LNREKYQDSNSPQTNLVSKALSLPCLGRFLFDPFESDRLGLGLIALIFFYTLPMFSATPPAPKIGFLAVLLN
jgi:hypothetical protein